MEFRNANMYINIRVKIKKNMQRQNQYKILLSAI